MSDHDTLIAEAMLGKDAEEFLNSDVGRYLLARAKEEIEQAQDELSSVSPWRRNRIKQLQSQVWRARSVKQWLAELITAGRQAESLLVDRDLGE